VSGLYDVVLPGLARRYREYLQETDALLDAPSVRIVEMMVRDLERMCAESRQLREELPRLRDSDTAWRGELAAKDQGERVVASNDPAGSPT